MVSLILNYNFSRSHGRFHRCQSVWHKHIFTIESNEKKIQKINTQEFQTHQNQDRHQQQAPNVPKKTEKKIFIIKLSIHYVRNSLRIFKWMNFFPLRLHSSVVHIFISPYAQLSSDLNTTRSKLCVPIAIDLILIWYRFWSVKISWFCRSCASLSCRFRFGSFSIEREAGIGRNKCKGDGAEARNNNIINNQIMCALCAT